MREGCAVQRRSERGERCLLWCRRCKVLGLLPKPLSAARCAYGCALFP